MDYSAAVQILETAEKLICDVLNLEIIETSEFYNLVKIRFNVLEHQVNISIVLALDDLKELDDVLMLNSG